MAQAMSFSEKGEKMELSQLKIPTHVSIIMDGNGRWAKSKGMPRTYGHSKEQMYLWISVRMRMHLELNI